MRYLLLEDLIDLIVGATRTQLRYIYLIELLL